MLTEHLRGVRACCWAPQTWDGALLPCAASDLRAHNPPFGKFPNPHQTDRGLKNQGMCCCATWEAGEEPLFFEQMPAMSWALPGAPAETRSGGAGDGAEKTRQKFKLIHLSMVCNPDTYFK